MFLLALCPAAARAGAADAVTAKVKELFDAYDNPVIGDLLSQERRHEAPIVADGVPNDSNAIFDQRRGQVLLNADLIEKNDKALAACGLGESKRAWVLAVQLLPSVAHEQRHAFVKWRLEDDPGYVPSTIEEEVAGFTNTLEVYEKLRSSDIFKGAYETGCATTYADADYRMDKKAWGSASDGVDGLLQLLGGSSYYKRMCSLRTDAETCKRAAERDLASASADDREELQKAAAFWSDDSKVAKARKYFESVEFVRTRAVFRARTPLP